MCVSKYMKLMLRCMIIKILKECAPPSLSLSVFLPAGQGEHEVRVVAVLPAVNEPELQVAQEP